jgi:deoxycytidylate deaminase
MAQLVATWSRDPSTKVGAVIVTPENVVVSVGYNGFAQRMPDVKSHYTDREAKYSRIDAEQRWKEAFEKARQYFEESGVTFDKTKV